MKRVLSMLIWAVPAALYIAGVAGMAHEAKACDYSLNLFNHRLQGDQLRLYVEMRGVTGLPIKGDLDAAKFDTVHNPGDATITSIATYQTRGDGLATLLMIDRSGSMRRQQARARDAAIQYVDSMDPKDEIALYFFSEQAVVRPFSDQAGVVRDDINKEMRGQLPKPMPGETTPLYKHLVDAIGKVSSESKKELSFVLVLTDGQEEVGGYTAQDVINAAREKHVPIFAVGFYQKTSRKDNSKELQILEKIANQTGGKYILADASSNLADIFIMARKRARNFIVVDSVLCGITRQDTAQAAKVDVQVAYEDCRSNSYSVPLPPLEKDIAACPQCLADADCKDGEKCAANRCEVLPCSKCQKPAGHACTDPACAKDEECGSECSCQQGKCAEKPPCASWQVFSKEEKECQGNPCSDSAACGADAECCSGRCAIKKTCSAWMKKDATTCSCLDITCKHDGQCPDGIPCDGEYCSDPQGKAFTKADCTDGKLSVNGRCEVVACADTADCTDDKTKEKWSCAPRNGLKSKDDKDKTCQLLRQEPCEEWEEAEEGACRVVACKEDKDCPEVGACDDKKGQCVAGGLCKKSMPICIGIGAFALLAIVFLGIAVRRRQKRGESLPDELTSGLEAQMQDPSKTQIADGGAASAQGGAMAGGSGQFESARPLGRTMPDVRGTPSSASSFVLEIDIQGHVDRRPLSYGTSTLGRDSGDIIIPHQIVSSTHLSIDVKDSGVVITDLESTNGTFVDGRRLAPHAPTPVTSAQQVMLGGTVRLAFVPAQGGGATPARKKQATQIVD